MESQVDTKFTWVVKNLPFLQSETVYSESFVIGGCKWRLIAYPKRKWLEDLTLEVADSKSFPIGWRIQAKVSATIVNHVSGKPYRKTETQQWFDHKTTRLDFQLMLTTLGFLVDEVKIIVEIDVLQVFSGFQVLPSQVKSVNRLFERQPDIASKFPIKNPLLRTAYMNILLSLTEILRLAPQKISDSDLSDSETTLAHMKTVGFKLDWLEKKHGEIKEKKEKERAGKIKIQNTEEKLKDLKQKCSDLKAQLETEKAAEVLAASVHLLLSDYDDVF